MALIDGLDALRKQFSLRDIASLIASTAMWVDRDTFHYLPVWYPDEGRRDLMYKSNWTKPQYNKNRTTGERVHKRVGNTKANLALTAALGHNTKSRPNWTCCHIWGVDDPGFQKPNSIVSDKRFYSCVANIVLLPTPLKAFTDAMPEIKTMLRVAASAYYGWSVEHPDIPAIEEERSICPWDSYPESWPMSPTDESPPGVVALNIAIKTSAGRRMKRIATDLESAGAYYPRQEVINVIQYWIEVLPAFKKTASECGIHT